MPTGRAPWQTIPDGSACSSHRGPGARLSDVQHHAWRAGNAGRGRCARRAREPLLPRGLRSGHGHDRQHPRQGAGRGTVDQAAPHRFNEYLYERFETHDWKGPSDWHRVKTAELQPHAGPVAQVMEVNRGPGHRRDETDRRPVQRTQAHRLRARHGQVAVGPARRHTPDDPIGKESVYVACRWPCRNTKFATSCRVAFRGRLPISSTAPTRPSTPCGISATSRTPVSA